MTRVVPHERSDLTLLLRAQGLTDLSSRQPPLLLLYLLLAIPTARRVSVSTATRTGIGLLDRRHHSLAIVSIRSPRDPAQPAIRRARWRLDAYGNGDAAIRLQRLLDDWQSMRRRGQTTLQANATPRNGKTELAFTWTKRDPRK